MNCYNCHSNKFVDSFSIVQICTRQFFIFKYSFHNFYSNKNSRSFLLFSRNKYSFYNFYSNKSKRQFLPFSLTIFLLNDNSIVYVDYRLLFDNQNYCMCPSLILLIFFKPSIFPLDSLDDSRSKQLSITFHSHVLQNQCHIFYSRSISSDFTDEITFNNQL